MKLIDFGASLVCKRVAVSEQITIQTLPYRAPEVLLGLSYTTSADMWSLGCICAELFLGRSIIPHGDSECEVVQRTVALVGSLPPEMLKDGQHTGRYFRRVEKGRPVDGKGQGSSWRRVGTIIRNIFKAPRSWSRTSQTPNSKIEWALLKKETKEQTESLAQCLERARFQLVKRTVPLLLVPKRFRKEDRQKQYRQRKCFANFLRRALTANGEKRWSPSQALEHNFVKPSKSSIVGTSRFTFDLGDKENWRCAAKITKISFERFLKGLKSCDKV